MIDEKDTLVEQTEAQRNPYLARPEQFQVMSPDAAAKLSLPGHKQCGNDEREYHELLRQGLPKQGKGAPLPTEVDDAAPSGTRNKD